MAQCEQMHKQTSKTNSSSYCCWCRIIWTGFKDLHNPNTSKHEVRMTQKNSLNPLLLSTLYLNLMNSGDSFDIIRFGHGVDGDN